MRGVFTITSTNRAAVGYTDDATTLSIPSNFIGNRRNEATEDEKYEVVAIGDNTFSDCTTLETVTLPSAVTSVENGAFSGCTNLTSVNVPETATVRAGAFADC